MYDSTINEFNRAITRSGTSNKHRRVGHRWIRFLAAIISAFDGNLHPRAAKIGAENSARGKVAPQIQRLRREQNRPNTRLSPQNNLHTPTRYLA